MRQKNGGGRSSSGKKPTELLPMPKVGWWDFFLQQAQKTTMIR